MSAKPTPLVHYFIEFRRRLLWCFLAWFFLLLPLLYFSNGLYHALALPLLKRLPAGQHLIATRIGSPFFVPFELAFITAFFIAMPIFLYQLWAFVAPALYRHERSRTFPLLLLSTLLFYSGAIFAYFVIFPLILSFFVKTAPAGVFMSPDIAEYLHFSLKLLLVFGLLFEVPVLTIVCIMTGAVKRAKLIQNRPYIIIASFILGMLLAPPDIFSQILFAVPIWFLFEMGIFLAPLFMI